MARRQRTEDQRDLCALLRERPHPDSLASKLVDAYGLEWPEADDALEDLFDDLTDRE